jgi:hypothetical protein
MPPKIWRYTLTVEEQSLWAREDMKGWCKALEGCVEDEAREQGMKRYEIYDRSGKKLPDPKPSGLHRDMTATY